MYFPKGKILILQSIISQRELFALFQQPWLRLGEMSESRETKGGTLNSFHLVHQSAETITIG